MPSSPSKPKGEVSNNKKSKKETKSKSATAQKKKEPSSPNKRTEKKKDEKAAPQEEAPPNISDGKEQYKCQNCGTELEILVDKAVDSAAKQKKTGYVCSICGDPFEAFCEDCWADANGRFCGGACKKYYCEECAPRFKFDVGYEMYCSIGCAPPGTKWAPGTTMDDDDDFLSDDFEFDEEDSDDDFFPSGPRQCHGITMQGTRCKITSVTPVSAAAPLMCGSKFCKHHGYG